MKPLLLLTGLGILLNTSNAAGKPVQLAAFDHSRLNATVVTGRMTSCID